MDFNQRKLTKMEWESIEVPVSMKEKEILKMIIAGYHDSNHKYNSNNTILTFMKISYEESIEQYIYDTYFKEAINNLKKKYELSDKFTSSIEKTKKVKLKKSDIIRLETNKIENLLEKKDEIYEYVLIDLVEKFLKYTSKKNDRSSLYYYTLVQIIDANVKSPNEYVISFTKCILDEYKKNISIKKLVTRADSYIENNKYLTKYCDTELYDHQKRLFQLFKGKREKNSASSYLALYTAPTATGKTMSPIGLSENHRIIFVCAARHVGLALAKSALSIQKKVAFAFGCECTEDVRIHWFATSSFVKRDTGESIRLKNGSYKTDHTDGSKVEIMICDIKSYLYAMYYMCSFNDKNNIITFWDEPTISLDYESHENHELITQIWSKNVIPNIVLSSATLPKQEEMYNLIRDYKFKFTNASIHNVSSSDCRKTIPLIDPLGKVIMPHLLKNQDFIELRKTIIHIQNNPTLLRYLDLFEISRFIEFMFKNNIIDKESEYKLDKYFPTVSSITMETLKNYYIDVLSLLDEETYDTMKTYFENNKSYRIGDENNGSNVGMLITTKESWTLTDGPTIFMTKTPETIGKFCLQQASIPSHLLDSIYNAIQYNTKVGKKIMKLEKQIEDMMNIPEENNNQNNGQANKKHSSDNKIKDTKEIRSLEKDMEQLQTLLKSIQLDSEYVPNSKNHIDKWISKELKEMIQSSENQPYFIPANEHNIQKIMELGNVENIWKLLLIMGIGMFSENVAPEYLEIMKSMAEKQELLVIIATDDYIYGTNYQFCHGYIGKDLSDMTQDKIIQALGRVGRNNIQQRYSVRFRTDVVADKLFKPQDNKIEVMNMNRLFVTEDD